MQNETIIQIVEGFKDKLYRYALKMVGNQFDAEDILQDLLIKVWKKKDEFSQLENQEAWCMTVTRNLAIDKIRKRKVKTTDITEHFGISDNAPTPDKITEDRESLKKVMDILNEMPESQREIIHLRDIEGYTYKEIAEIIGMTEDQVKVNLFRARQRFKEKLKVLNI